MSRKYNTETLYFTDKLRNKLSDIKFYPLTIMEAPCGYGKTTAAKEFLKKQEKRVLWMELDSNSINDFLVQFCDCFSEIDENITLKMKKASIDKDTSSFKEILILFENIHLSEEWILVIDNFQLVQNDTISNFIIRISEILRKMHIVILTQNSILENVLDVILKKQLNYITKSYFELDSDDIQKYYELCGINLDEREAVNLYEYCGGWVSILYFQMLDYIENKSFQLAEKACFFVEKIVNDKFSEEAKANFLKICVCEDFTIEKLKFILESTDVSNFIEEIHKANIFIEYDADRKIYYMQKIFKDFLQKKFERIDTNFQSRALLMIGKWFQNDKKYLKAILIFYKIKDFQSIFSMDVEVDSITKDMNSNDIDTVLEIVQTCPKEIKDRYPKNLLGFVLILSQYKEWNYLGLLEKEIENSIENNKILSLSEKRNLNVALSFLSAFTTCKDIKVINEESKKAYEILGGQQTKFINLRKTWTWGSPSILYIFHRKSGELDREFKIMNECMPYYYELTDNHDYGVEAVMEAEIRFNRGDFKGAEILCYKAIYMSDYVSENKKQYSIYLCAVFIMLRISIAYGNVRQLNNSLKKLKEKVKEKNLVRAIDLCEGFIFSSIGQVELIPEWLRLGKIEKEGISFLTVSYSNIIYGKVLFLKGEYLKLLGISQQFLEVASTFESIYSYIYIHIHMALANLKLNERGRAVEFIKVALEIAATDKIYMPFVENGEYILEIFDEIKQNDLYKSSISDILKLYGEYKSGLDKIRNSDIFNKVPQMTERELEVAMLAAQNLTNREIGEQLYISQNTVKFYLKSIFSKLSITSRSQLKVYF
ncbi:LuxR family maltose regulon positive regulatory protein [Clostridium beijerinckii]|uniref:LuxR C-terminal-related transcriptional regulator n=1 Tax=Clostridium beijerinckii TaxID=1520 RepID=UPI00156D41D4|nr:LuxR C-terminal-related transcriptional regulator [Clostridium beijerinckii]NRT33428.1 LuxR family maltose regulon positive regulatory protein [Clostridium beijerinckii]NRT47145.1 LuxR family maltose regulon positive regulatory protein [Clostridium beijerinckii]NRZ18851.1 LuxR family maltose regulon positive regulatory protein [Clostridium beijerinckii]